MFVLSSLKFRNWIGYVNNREFEEINICLHLSKAPQEPQERGGRRDRNHKGIQNGEFFSELVASDL